MKNKKNTTILKQSQNTQKMAWYRQVNKKVGIERARY
jgi:hypothetical protein